MIMVKLIAIDMDGTLLNSQKEIPQENIAVIQEAARSGYKIVLCTGRMQTGVEPYFEQLGLAAEQEYAILNNGCSLHTINRDWQLLTYHDLNFNGVSYLYDLLEGYPEIDLTLTADRDYLVLADQVSELVAYDASLVFTQAQTVGLNDVKHAAKPVFQAMYLGESDRLDAFQQKFECKLAEKFTTVRSQPYIFEVMPRSITKATGLRELAQKLKISRTDIMAIGDALNDLEMLKAAGFSVAMGNASPEVKAAADLVTGSNDDAGVAQAIAKYVLNK
ncbi:Cof-type HAD-IIB family hydrolase [Streptococcus mutans]|nr:Cof-type HAD-IIB family hydrolase [Streptococcus mutans]EMC20203.1 hypothetical protein SMU80_07629 [Streptococcus mutans SF1]EMC41479.1 hypothetical protein SMU97_08784 [Streptococcus mutans SM4]MCB5047317.1 Cof-type HAD-IIB family hydrolase [Streptococcus mutans]